MKYRKFIINGYRGMSGITEVNITKESLIPIIGKNESGKTTCLEAIYAFDYTNDQENNGKHLENIENLYSTLEPPVIIGAEIEVDTYFNFESNFREYYETIKEEFSNPQEEGFDILKVDVDEYEGRDTNFIKAFQLLSLKIQEGNSLLIERDLRLKKYSFPLLTDLLDSDFQNSLGKAFVGGLPYTLYFDDFRDRVPDNIYIIKDNKDPLYTRWVMYIVVYPFFSTRS